MGDIAQRGNRLTFAKGGTVRRPKKPSTHGKDVPTMAAKGGRIGKFGGGRTNLLEQLGRVEAEPSNPNRRAEISRVHGELNRGYAKGGRAGHFAGGKALARTVKNIRDRITHEVPTGPHTDVRRREINPSFGNRDVESGRTKERKRKRKIMGMGWKNVAKRMVGQKEGGRIGLKKGGSDKKWIQKAVNPKHKGYCTPMTKKTCTPARKALARTFKKKAKTGWG